METTLLAQAETEVERRRALGWTQADFAQALAELLETPELDKISDLP